MLAAGGFSQIPHRRGRHPCLQQAVTQVLDAVLRGPCLNGSPQLRFVPGTTGVVDKARVDCQLRLAHALAQALKQPVAGDRNHHQPVGSPVGVKRGGHRMPVPHQPRCHTVGIQVGQTGHLQAEQHVEHGHIDVLRARRMALAGKQSRTDGPGGVDPGTQVPDGLAAAGRPRGCKPGDTHQARHGLGHNVIGRATRQRTVLPETGNTGVNQPRVVLLQRIEINAQTPGDAGSEVLHQHIGVGHQFVKALTVRRVFEINLDAALAAIDEAEVHAFARQKRPQMPCVIALLRHLELNDISPQVRQHRGAMRARQYAADVQHAHALQLLSKRTVAHGCCLTGSSGQPLTQAGVHRAACVAHVRAIPTFVSDYQVWGRLSR